MKFLLLLLLFPLITFAHGNDCGDKKRDINQGARTNNLSPLEDDYDVTYLKLDISLNNMNTAVAGHATTNGKVTNAAGMATYAFELNSVLVIDSIRFNGVLLTASTTTAGLRTVALPTLLNQNASFSAKVYYHGSTPPGTGFFTHGLNPYYLNNTTNITFSLSDQYLAMDWWPAKQSLLDKIDSADLWFTIPDSCVVGSNGLLQGVTTLPGNLHRYEWKTRYPIAYYLISASVAPYTEVSSYMHFTDGSNDSMLVQNFIYNPSTFLPAYGPAMDSTGIIIDYFSTLFGRYPFWQEKYGHCLAPLGGGMEHQTMTTIGSFTTPLISHELGHQWWGNHVTYGSWRDIWLSEGFAAYCEELFIEKFRGVVAVKNYRTGVFNRILAGLAGSVYVDDTSSAARIFSNRLTYDKGAAVAHMLRYVAPADSLYFQVLKTYQQTYANGTAKTPDLQMIAENIYQQDLDSFFNQWVYGQGHPRYGVRWNQIGNTVLVQLSQNASAPSTTSVFATPLDIDLQTTAGTSRVRVYNNAAVQTFSLPINGTCTGVLIDEENNILNTIAGSIVNDPKLSIASTTANVGVLAYPNPATKGWHFSLKQEHDRIQLADNNGKLVWTASHNGPNEVRLPADGLPVGLYYLSVFNKGKKIYEQKLMKQ